MFSKDNTSDSSLIFKKFPLREPLRRNYQTQNLNPFGKKTPDLFFSYSIQKQIKIPIYANKLYKKQAQNTIAHQSQSMNTSIHQLQPILKAKTIEIRTQSTEPNLLKKLSKPFIMNQNVQNSTIPDDSSQSSDDQQLKRTFLNKYRRSRVNQCVKQPKFTLNSLMEGPLDPWFVDS